MAQANRLKLIKKIFGSLLVSLILAIPTILSYWLVTFTLLEMYVFKKPYEEVDKLWENIEKFPDNGEFLLFGLILINIVIQVSPKRSVWFNIKYDFWFICRTVSDRACFVHSIDKMGLDSYFWLIRKFIIIFR